jgi:poly-gamma-glutamate capsule biosynthesis protein CapA/YwtB (metallophosphatase superfamily)
VTASGEEDHGTTTHDLRRARMLRRRRVVAVVVVALAVALVATVVRAVHGARTGETSSAGSTGAASVAPGSTLPGGSATSPATSDPSLSPSSNPSDLADEAREVHLAFAGDVHAEGTSASVLTQGMGSGAAPLARADVAVVNVETAITTRGSAAGKQFVFRAPPTLLQVLRRGGVDAVSVANNHGEDYGRVGLADTLAASRSTHLPVIGAGVDQSAAFAPFRRTVDGVRVSVIAATDVLDAELATAWTATPDSPGLASAKDDTTLLDAVRAERARSDVLVVFLHWGKEREVCPTDRQRQLAGLLADAGADVVAGSHAHVVQPQARIGSTVVAYGMGNFTFYATGDAGTRTGVFQVTAKAVPGAGAARPRELSTSWVPARIVGGRPIAVSDGDPLPSLSACG